MSCKTDSCPEYCKHAAVPYIGVMGWLGYIVESVPLIWTALMVIGVAPQDYKPIVVVLSIVVILDLIFWLINYARFASCFQIGNYPSCEPCGCDLIERGSDPCEFAVKVRAQIKQSADQEHLQTSLVGGLVAFLMFGIFLWKYGTAAFGLITDPSNPAQVMLYVIAKAIQVWIVAVYANVFKLMLETKSDLIYRLTTAVVSSTGAARSDGSLSSKKGGSSLLGKRKNALDQMS